MVKQLFLSFVCLLLMAPYAQAAEVIFNVSNPQGVYAISSNELSMTAFVKCYDDLKFRGNSFIKTLNLPPGTQSLTMPYEQRCLSYKILGIGVLVTADWLSLPQTGPIVFQQSLSFETAYRGPALNNARTESWNTNSQVVQTIDVGDRPTQLYNTNNWSRRVDAGYWMNNGFPSQFDTNILSSDFTHVNHNDSYKNEDSSGTFWIQTVDGYNLTLTGLGANSYDIPPFVNGKFSVFIGDAKDLNYSILDVAAAYNNTFTINKGQLMIAPYDTFTDAQQNEILQEMLTSLRNLSTQDVVNVVQDQTSWQQQNAQQERQEAQQRQEQIMNSNTASGEASIANFMTSFDDGADPSLAGVITKPLEFIQALTTTSCFPLTLPLPLVNSNLTLPCGRAYLANFASPLLALWDVISVGLLSYWIATHLYVMIHEFKNPDNDGNIQPLDL